MYNDKFLKRNDNIHLATIYIAYKIKYLYIFNDK